MAYTNDNRQIISSFPNSIREQHYWLIFHHHDHLCDFQISPRARTHIHTLTTLVYPCDPSRSIKRIYSTETTLWKGGNKQFLLHEEHARSLVRLTTRGSKYRHQGYSIRSVIEGISYIQLVAFIFSELNNIMYHFYLAVQFQTCSPHLLLAQSTHINHSHTYASQKNHSFQG